MYLVTNLTAICIFPNAESERRECDSVNLAYDVKRADPTPGFSEIKQEYISRRAWIEALAKIKIYRLCFLT